MTKDSCLVKGVNVLLDMTNCASLYYSEERKCTVCKAGHYFKEQECIVCEAGEGCFSCNPRQPTECLICDDGYH